MNGTSFVKKFEEANPGIKLNLEVVSWNDVYTVVSTRISNNNAPDILNLDSFADYANEGLLMPVKDYCPDELFNDFFPSFIAQSVIDDTVWAVPDLASARALYYNVDLLEQAGVEVPTTWAWAELEDACQALVDFYGGDAYPWGIDMTTDEGQAAFAYYAWGNDGGFVDADGNWIINCDANVEALEFAIGLYNKGYTNPNPATQTRYDLQDMFGAGKLAMVIAPNSLPTYIEDKGYTGVNYAVADIPHNEGKTSSSVGVMDRIMAFNQAFAIWLLRGTFVSISPEMEQAACIDGCTTVGALVKILLPMAAPGIVTTLIFVFINAWNEYTISTVLISTPTNKPITVGITQFSSFNMIEWQYLFAAALIATIPVIILFMCIEKHLAEGLTSGGVKG